MSSARWLSVLAFLLLAGLGAFVVPRLRVEADITHFLPAGEDRALAELSGAITSSELNRTITLTIAAPDASQAARAALALAEKLRAREDVSWVTAGPDESLQQAFYEAYFPHRLGFVSDDEAALATAFSEDALRERARRLRAQLASPTGTFVRRIAPEDPWLLFLDHVDRLREALQGDLAVHEGGFVSGCDEGDAGCFGVVLATSAFSPFEVARSRTLDAAIDEAFAEVRGDAPWTLERAGVHRLAVRSEATIRGDIERVSMAGSIGVVLLMLLLFRSPRLLLLGALPLVGGGIAAVAAVQWLFGAIHGLTLAFGATLLGVALDYVAHLFTHLHLAPAEGTEAGPSTAKRLAPGLYLGAATTVAGLVGLAWTSFPGIRQMAVFTSVGVTVALLLTRFAVPPLLPARPAPGALLRGFGRGAQRALDALASRRGVVIALAVLAALLAATGLPQLRWQDDIRALNPLDPQVAAEDERVRGRVARLDAGRFVAAFGADEEAALVATDALHHTLADAKDADELARFRTVHPLLWSRALQETNHAAIPDDAFERTVRAYEAEGFVAAPFEPFRSVLAAERAALGWAELSEGPLGRLIGAQRVNVGERVALLAFVQGVRDEDALRARVEAIEGVRYFDQSAFLQDAYATFRTRTLELVAFGLVFVLLLVVARYRKLDLSFAAYLPALLAAGATLGLLGWLGIEANLLHVVTLLLVLSMGVDYGVFMVEAELHRRREGDAEVDDGPATAVSLFVAALSTAASFGVLAISDNPALRAMGLTAALGVTLSLVLAPGAWLLVRRR
ncbi:MAG: MMPL family transporter [Sandaracinus sp.]|nr:MMPL family transporter [Sandaracinus sp.]MCB9622659.1 MMPL family transporter [Sandaracinus sp.]MCB9632959.1 MMPL family transporter [Sandaracinus sp.]